MCGGTGDVWNSFVGTGYDFDKTCDTCLGKGLKGLPFGRYQPKVSKEEATELAVKAALDKYKELTE